MKALGHIIFALIVLVLALIIWTQIDSILWTFLSYAALAYLIYLYWAVITAPDMTDYYDQNNLK
jgi:threonine/homoserine/homoserine lactone efflux protein